MFGQQPSVEERGLLRADRQVGADLRPKVMRCVAAAGGGAAGGEAGASDGSSPTGGSITRMVLQAYSLPAAQVYTCATCDELALSIC